MATLNPNYPTFLDVAKRTHDRQIQKIVEITAQNNPMIRDGMAMEGNLPTGHRSTQRTGLPTPTWRLLNQGVPQSKSTTQQVDDTCGMLESYAEVDLALANLNGNRAAFVASEDIAFLESMSQTQEQTSFEGDTGVNPERFLGFAPRYSSLSTNPLNSGYNIINHGGSNPGSHTSIWLITWGPMASHYIFPKGSRAGWQRQFLGQQTKTETNGNQYEILRTHYKWDIGLTVRDWRANVRVANIDTAAAAGTDTIEESLIRAVHRMRKMGGGRTLMYLSEEMHARLDIRAQAKTNVHLTHGEWAGEQVLFFRGGIPIRQTDALTDTEGTIS